MLSPMAQQVRMWLETYVQDEEYINTQYERVRALEVTMVGLGAMNLSDMPKAPSPANDKLEKMMIKKEELKEWITQLEEKHENDEKWMKELISKLEHVSEKAVIEFRYLDGLEWDRIICSMYSKQDDFVDNKKRYERRVFRIHESALEYMAQHWSR